MLHFNLFCLSHHFWKLNVQLFWWNNFFVDFGMRSPLETSLVQLLVTLYHNRHLHDRVVSMQIVNLRIFLYDVWLLDFVAFCPFNVVISRFVCAWRDIFGDVLWLGYWQWLSLQDVFGLLFVVQDWAFVEMESCFELKLLILRLFESLTLDIERLWTNIMKSTGVTSICLRGQFIRWLARRSIGCSVRLRLTFLVF